MSAGFLLAANSDSLKLAKEEGLRKQKLQLRWLQNQLNYQMKQTKELEEVFDILFDMQVQLVLL